jgi:hypothetical protein
MSQSDSVLEAIAELHAAVDRRVQEAYEHGFNAGIRHAELEVDRTVYRRGYSTGYAAAKRGSPADADGAHARGGRPRLVG